MAMQTTRESVATSELATTNYAAMAMVMTLFFMRGLLTSLNDILVPHLKLIFDLNYAEVMLIHRTSEILNFS
jgi:FHS family L-fucose permease-like MFS transporter